MLWRHRNALQFHRVQCKDLFIIQQQQPQIKTQLNSVRSRKLIVRRASCLLGQNQIKQGTSRATTTTITSRDKQQENGLTSECYLVCSIPCKAQWREVALEIEINLMIYLEFGYKILLQGMLQSSPQLAAHTSCVCILLLLRFAFCSLSRAMSCWIFALTACGYLINKQWRPRKARKAPQKYPNTRVDGFCRA